VRDWSSTALTCSAVDSAKGPVNTRKANGECTGCAQLSTSRVVCVGRSTDRSMSEAQTLLFCRVSKRCSPSLRTCSAVRCVVGRAAIRTEPLDAVPKRLCSKLAEVIPLFPSVCLTGKHTAIAHELQVRVRRRVRRETETVAAKRGSSPAPPPPNPVP